MMPAMAAGKVVDDMALVEPCAMERALVMPAVAAGKVVDDMALVEPCAMERPLVTPLGAGRPPGVIRGRRDGCDAVGGAISMLPVATMAAPAAAAMVACRY